KYCVSDLSSCACSELGSELTSLVGSELTSLAEDIQCASSDTRPPMLDRTDFALWQQRIRLYFRGKKNGVNILKSIDEGPFQMGTLRETTSSRQNRGQGNNAHGTGAASYEGAQNRVGYANTEYFKYKMLLMQALENEVTLDEEQLLFIVGGQDNVVDDDVDEQPIQDLALNVDNVFQADDCDAFDSDVDEAPTDKLCSWLISHP
nr:retrovirus-related Pol polyprotein from transposon TNT 1-94 [Tanacetum cinerariifolium]